MLVHVLLAFCLAFNFAIKTADCQFYVDVDHSMPRFGKRTDENKAAENVVADRGMYEHQQQQKELDEDRRILTTFARTLKLIKLLDKKYENI